MFENDPGAKALVFSQYTSMLDLIAYRMHQVGASTRGAAWQEGGRAGSVCVPNAPGREAERQRGGQAGRQTSRLVSGVEAGGRAV